MNMFQLIVGPSDGTPKWMRTNIHMSYPQSVAVTVIIVRMKTSTTGGSAEAQTSKATRIVRTSYPRLKGDWSNKLLERRDRLKGPSGQSRLLERRDRLKGPSGRSKILERRNHRGS